MPPKETKLKKKLHDENVRAPVRPLSQSNATLSSSRSRTVSASRKGRVKSTTATRKLNSAKRRNAPSKAGHEMLSFSVQSDTLLPAQKDNTPLEGETEGVNNSLDSNDKKAAHPRTLQMLADRLAHSLVALRSDLAEMEQRIASLEQEKPPTERRVLGLFEPKRNFHSDINRARQEKAQLMTEIGKTNNTIRELLCLSNRLDEIQQQKAKNLGSAKKKLEMEIKELEIEKELNASIIREGFVNRVNLLRRYWPWRQLLELGDTTVANTFEEELKRGPRYRHVGIQNNVQTDYLEQQIKWLEALKSREGSFQNRLWQIEKFVEDLYDINDMIEEALLCKVCGMLYDEPVLFWPCGHSFCHECFQSLAIAPSLYRCPTCGSIDSEGFVHNLLLADTVAKWMFKDLGFNGLQAPLSSIRIHLARFQKSHSEDKLIKLKQILKEQSVKESEGGACDTNSIMISYRRY